MKKSGIILFSIIFGTWLLPTVYILLAMLWFLLTVIILSPMFIITNNLLQIQNFTIIGFIISLVFLIAGFLILPYLLKITKSINDAVKKYFSYYKSIIKK